MRVEFLATLQGPNVISYDDEMAGKIKLTFDGSQYPQISKLGLLTRQLLKVTVEPCQNVQPASSED